MNERKMSDTKKGQRTEIGTEKDERDKERRE